MEGWRFTKRYSKLASFEDNPAEFTPTSFNLLEHCLDLFFLNERRFFVTLASFSTMVTMDCPEMSPDFLCFFGEEEENSLC